jgi:hypothetical protein
MLIDAGTERFAALFGHHPFQTTQFSSRMPPYETLVRCLVDPSICQAGKNPIDQIESAMQLFADQTADIVLGTQYMVYKNVVRQVGDIFGATTGMLKQYQPQIDLLMKSVQVGRSLLESDIEDVLVEAGFGIAMKALGAAGWVGKIVAAVIGLGRMIYDVISQRKKIHEQEAAQREARAWALMPPLQEPSADTDSYMANKDVIERMSTGSWTRIFAPRFDPDLEWVGVERRTGFAFAPGATEPGKDLFGRPTQAFVPSNGVGLVPGFDFITSVIQVSLPFDDPEIKKWKADRSYSWPLRPRMVRDVGSYYANSGRLAAVAWAWATDNDASPDLYKIDVGTPTSNRTECLHWQWKRYYQMGFKYLRERVTDPNNLMGDDLEYLYGAALACGLGAWQCKYNEELSTTYHPRFLRLDPKLTRGLPREEMNNAISLEPYGCTMRPKWIKGMAEGNFCLVSLYDTHIRETLEKVRARQVHFLRHSLVCAYVRAGWDTFKDPDLRDLLWKMRATLLKHPDRQFVNMEDVPENETMPNGDDWRKALIKAGAGKNAGPFQLKGRAPGTIEPTDDEPPRVPSSLDRMPFADYGKGGGDKDNADEGEAGKTSLSYATIGLAGGASLVGGWLAYRMFQTMKDRRGGRTWTR